MSWLLFAKYLVIVALIGGVVLILWTAITARE